jgi:hypothetical protein
VVALPARSAEEHAVAIAAEVAAVLAEVLGLQRGGGEFPRNTGVVDHAGVALRFGCFVQEGEELLCEEEVGEVVRLHLRIVACRINV